MVRALAEHRESLLCLQYVVDAGRDVSRLFIFFNAGRMPSDKLWLSVLDLNLFGPSSEGNYFPDAHKMELCVNYLKFVFSKDGMKDACVALIDEQYASKHRGTTYVDAFVHQMLHDYYTAPGDALRGTKQAVHRIHQSMHAKACLADIFATLLKHQLVPCMVASRNGQNVDYQTLAIVRDVLTSRRGAKDALQRTIQAFVRLYMQYGPYLLCTVQPAMKEGEAVQGLLRFVLRDISRLAKSLGTTISCLAWLYGKEASEDADALADLCRQTVLNEIGSTDLTQIHVLLGTMSEELFIAKVKLRFVMALQGEMIPQVRPKLAEKFEIAHLYNIIHGW
jgi:hypothetical protein